MTVRNTLATMLFPLALLPAAAFAGEVSLSGQGSVRYEPDSARLQFTARAEDEQAQQATAQVAEMIRQWREGISEYQAQLHEYTDASVNLYTRTVSDQARDQEPRLQAVASQTVSFRIDDLTLLNPLLEQAQAIGLQYSLNPSQFFHSNEAELEREALGKAIDDARDRCDFVARKLDLQCGDVVSLNVSGGFRPVAMMRTEAKAMADTVASIGEREIQASVNATFELD